MAHRRLKLLTGAVILPTVEAFTLGGQDDAVDRLEYASPNWVINNLGDPIPNFIVAGIYGQRAGATSSTTNSIASVTMFGGLVGGIYNAVPLRPSTQHTFGRLLQFWGAFVNGYEESITTEAFFSNSQTRCSMFVWAVRGCETVTPYSSAGVQGNVTTGDLSAAINTPAGAVTLAMATQNQNAAFTWGGGVTESLGGSAAADSSFSAAQGSLSAGPHTITADVPGVPNASMMQVVALR